MTSPEFAVSTATPCYPTTVAERQQLADGLNARGFRPTQVKRFFDRAKVDAMIRDMVSGAFDWSRASFRPVILGPQGEVMGGHHRVIAAHLAGLDLTAVPGPRPQVQPLPVNFRPVYRWDDVLPDAP